MPALSSRASSLYLIKPVRLSASATHTLPRWSLLILCTFYIFAGLLGRDPWKNEDAAGFGIMWSMAHGGLQDWLWPHIAGLKIPGESPAVFWAGAICIKLFGSGLGDVLAARIANIIFFIIGITSVWYTAYQLGQRAEAQPLTLAFGGQPEPQNFGRTLADGALLIYLGCIGFMVHSHHTTAPALQVALIAFCMAVASRLFSSKKFSIATALILGVALGFATLTRGWLVPWILWLSLLMLAFIQRKTSVAIQLFCISLPVAALVTSIWLVSCLLVQPFGGSPVDAWLQFNLLNVSSPSFQALGYLLKNGSWFAWPAWPFAGWALYAWRKQLKALHIALPLAFLLVLLLLALCNPYPEEGVLLTFLPALSVLASFGLPTMKRALINAVDWFSVMTLTVVAAVIWAGWLAIQTGWQIPLAKNAFKLAPGFVPSFEPFAAGVAVFATLSWFLLLRWRLARHPAVLWRAVVLSCGGGILCWLLLMTLWLPWGNYIKSYAGVAQQSVTALPTLAYCVESNVGAAQRASFAYFGKIKFASFSDETCNFYLLQDRYNDKKISETNNLTNWRLLWEGHRPADREERFRLYQRKN